MDVKEAVLGDGVAMDITVRQCKITLEKLRLKPLSSTSRQFVTIPADFSGR